MYLKLFKIISILIVTFITSINLSAKEIPPSLKEITQIEERGKQIAEYEQVAIKATDLLLASKPDRSKLGIYIAINQDNIWNIYFGKIVEDNKKFKVSYVYSCPEGLYNEMKQVETTKAISQKIFQLAKAVKVALESVAQETNFKYNTNVFREKNGLITVYLTPGNENPNIILLGGDFKLSISADGSKILNKIQLHKSILEVPLRMKGNQRPAGAFHTHVLDDLPTETDVAMVLLNPIIAPHYITGQKWMSRIDANGKITILGKTEEILKSNTK